MDYGLAYVLFVTASAVPGAADHVDETFTVVVNVIRHGYDLSRGKKRIICMFVSEVKGGTTSVATFKGYLKVCVTVQNSDLADMYVMKIVNVSKGNNRPGVN